MKILIFQAYFRSKTNFSLLVTFPSPFEQAIFPARFPPSSRLLLQIWLHPIIGRKHRSYRSSCIRVHWSHHIRSILKNQNCIPHFYSGSSVNEENSNMAEKMEGEAKLVNLPLARIKTIMKSSPDVSHAGQESIFMVAKATVSKSLFIGSRVAKFIL